MTETIDQLIQRYRQILKQKAQIYKAFSADLTAQARDYGIERGYEI